MDLERIIGGLRPSEKEAIAVLESRGWTSMFDCSVEDGRDPYGDGFRTHRHSGRHDLVLILKRVDGRELPAEEVETDPAPVKKKR